MSGDGRRRRPGVYRYLVAVLATTLGLGTIGASLGPTWAPQPVRDRLVVQTSAIEIGGSQDTAPAGTYATTETDLDIELDGATVTARLTAPVGAPDGAPGVVFMHGAGTAGHANFADQAQVLASAGVYVLVPAKRMDTYTTVDRDYVAMAADYLHSFDVLAATDGVDPDAVGLYGESEGAWIAPVAAVMQPDIAFVILVSAPVVPPRQQGAYAMDNYLRATHVPASVLQMVPRALGGQIPGGGFEYIDFDVRPWQVRMTQPTLVVYGTADISMPIEQGAMQVVSDLARAGNEGVTVRYLEGANHGIKIDGELAPGFAEVLTEWTLGLPGSATAQPMVAGDQPEQHYRADAVPRPAWYASGDMLIVWGVVALGLLAVGGLAGTARLLIRRGERMHPTAARLSLATGLASLATLVLFAAYGVTVADLALNYRTNDVIAVGGWLAVRGAAVVAVAIGVRSVMQGLPLRTSLARPDGTAKAHFLAQLTWWSTHLGALTLMLILAYWSVLPSPP